MTVDELLSLFDITEAPIGVYDAPDPEPFKPLAEPAGCVFRSLDAWREGKTLMLTPDDFGCPGCGYWFFGIETRDRDSFLEFLTDSEGLRENRELMAEWLDSNPPYKPKHRNLFVGPLKEGMEPYLKTVAFLVKPDSLSALMHGAVYHSRPDDPTPVTAPFGSTCGQILCLFGDLTIPQAAIAATDMAMRQYLPADAYAFVVTPPMFERLLSLDPDHSFLGKPFWNRLRDARRDEA